MCRNLDSLQFKHLNELRCKKSIDCDEDGTGFTLYHTLTRASFLSFYETVSQRHFVHTILCIQCKPIDRLVDSPIKLLYIWHLYVCFEPVGKLQTEKLS